MTFSLGNRPKSPIFRHLLVPAYYVVLLVVATRYYVASSIREIPRCFWGYEPDLNRLNSLYKLPPDFPPVPERPGNQRNIHGDIKCLPPGKRTESEENPRFSVTLMLSCQLTSSPGRKRKHETLTDHRLQHCDEAVRLSCDSCGSCTPQERPESHSHSHSQEPARVHECQ